jgi:hypothetical protein
MTDSNVSLSLTDAAELAQVITFLTDWLAHDHVRLDESLARFVGNTGYRITHLKADLERFAFLLDGGNTRMFNIDS